MALAGTFVAIFCDLPLRPYSIPRNRFFKNVKQGVPVTGKFPACQNDPAWNNWHQFTKMFGVEWKMYTWIDSRSERVMDFKFSKSEF